MGVARCRTRPRPTRPPARRFNHLVLNVRDIEASHHFYTELMGFEQCGELTHTMTMRFYRGDASRHHDFALVQVADPDRFETPRTWSMEPRPRDQPHRHRVPRSRIVARPAPPPAGQRRRVPRPRQPRHDPLRVHRRPRRQRHRGALRPAERGLGGRRRRRAQPLRGPPGRGGARGQHGLPCVRRPTRLPRRGARSRRTRQPASS